MAVAAVLLGCEAGGGPVEPGETGARQISPVVAASPITTIDLSSGSGLAGRALVIGNSGLVLGLLDGRGWWQAPAPAFTRIDAGGLLGGNRIGDAAGGENNLLLSTSGGAPWTSVTPLRPAGISSIVTADINDARVVTGFTLGVTPNHGLRWDGPGAVPVQLPLPALRYPAQLVRPVSISNSGLIAGYVNEGSVRGVTQSEAILWTPAGPVVLPSAPGATAQVASAVNDAGMVSGYVTIARNAHPARWVPNGSGGYTVAVANLVGGSDNVYTAIDGCGRVTGGSEQGAFVWDGVSPPTLLPSISGKVGPGIGLDINDAGQVVGTSVSVMTKKTTIRGPTLWTGLPPCTPAP
jgi:hypothetical protein